MSTTRRDPPTGSAGHLGVEPPLSRLGLGAWAFGRTGWGSQDDRDSRSAILRAIECGIGWIDTAAVYGDGHSERLVGTVLREVSDAERPLVFTKGGLRVDPSDGSTSRDLNSSSLRRECDASMKRLKVEQIDLYQLHWPVAEAGIVEQAWDTLAALRSEGKIRWAGVSNFDHQLLKRCAANHKPDAVQLPLSLLNRERAAELLPWAADSGVHALVYSPLESGLLSGRFSIRRLRSLRGSDWRRQREQFQEPKLRRTLNLVTRLDPIARSLGMSVSELAIAWTSAWRGVGGVIVGARSAEQVDGWVGASKLILDGATLRAIEVALRDTGAGAGPTLPEGSPDSRGSER